MANMSAAILREIVARVFETKATSVILSGVISPEYVQSKGSSSGGLWSESSLNLLWGFDPQKGFIPLHEYAEEYWNDGHDGPRHSDGASVKLADIPGVDGFVFFLEKRAERYSCPCNKEYRDEISFALFKAANFAAFREKITTEDIARWERWLEE